MGGWVGEYVPSDLVLELGRETEDVGVILSEAPHAHQAVESATAFVSGVGGWVGGWVGWMRE